MSETQIRIVSITSIDEANFSRKFLTGIIGVAFNKNYIAFSPDISTVFIYPTKPLWNYIVSIFEDPNILKLISKPKPALDSFILDISKHEFKTSLQKNVICNNCQHISHYMSQKDDSRSIPEMKKELVEQNLNTDFFDKTISIALIIIKYKNIADIFHSNPLNKKPNKNFFNKHRDCYLLYLTAFNDILIHNGSLPFIKLATLVKSYPYLCHTNINSFNALEALIKVGALSLEHRTTIVSIPDQLP